MRMSHRKNAHYPSERYGSDELFRTTLIASLVMLVIGLLLMVFGRFAPVYTIIAVILFAVALELSVWAMFRCLSRRSDKRMAENEAFLRLFRRKPRAKKSRQKKPGKVSLPPDTDTHVFRACPHCSAVIRLPKQKGKHQVRCPRCGKPFHVRVK